MGNKSIAFKFASYIIATTSLILALMFTYSYIYSTRIIKEKIEENAKNLTQSVVNKIDAILLPIQKIPSSLAIFLENSDLSEKELLKLIKETVENNPDIYGCTVAFEPYKFDRAKLYFAPYYYRSGNKIKFKYVGSSSYRYFYWDWYQIPKELGKAVWSEPYYGKGSQSIMSTYSVPFYKVENGKKIFMGVVAVDVSLDWLKKMISSIKIGESGYAFLISKYGRFITYPKKRFIMNETIFTVAEEYNNPHIRKIGMMMIHGKTGLVLTKSILTGKECWLSFAPISSNGWSVGVMFPKQELLLPIKKLNINLLLLGVFGFGMLVMLIFIISRSITKPIVALGEITKDVSKGRLDIEIPYTHLKDEIGGLAKSFEQMKKSLKLYIENLKETTAAKERIESELDIASKIQSSMLPCSFLPDIKEFDIYAVMKPARKVGGDFYDFFFVEKNKLCFLIGDVSGKGVPASLFMAIIRYLIKTDALRGLSPAETLTRVNRIIAQDNERCMFATVFMGILNTENGEIEFANAGHLPPVVCYSESTGFIKVKNGFVVGVMKEAHFENQSIKLNKNDTIFLYTDGVTEAINKNSEQFGKDRLIKALSENCSKDTQGMVKDILNRINEFAQGVNQYDDITMLALKYIGLVDKPSPSKE
ncbi:SpoIIE family protein phosphatase [Hippea alviniae]|uniref:SpoIIE family protein phosphatase n=1 Tax=Hippea alviniae TaxID=1279027 RepID=UPI0003B30B29|nr:SpoIIE family protein phosphatase [Hippea alviniae]